MQEVLPVDDGFVGLGEALSWIGWHHAMTNLELCAAIDSGSLGKDARDLLQDAIKQLLVQGEKERIKFYGKPRRNISDVDAKTIEITSLQLIACQRYEIVHDALLVGSGLFWFNSAPLELKENEGDSSAGFEDVFVDRAQLLAAFQPVHPCPDDRVRHFLFEQGEWVPASTALKMLKPNFLIDQAGKHDDESKPKIRTRCSWLRASSGWSNHRELYWWFWNYIEVQSDWDNALYVRRDSTGAEYTACDVEFSLDDINRITGLQEGIAPAPHKSPRKRVHDKAAIDQWYQERVRAALAKDIRYSREEDARAGKEIFGIGRDKVRAIRKKFAPEHWQEAGRPTD